MTAAFLSSKKCELIMALILAAAFAIRLLFIIFAQTDAGDTSTYETFANNILRGCGMSQTPSTSTECIASSGGYFPGYPAFIASVWYMVGRSTGAVLFAQLLCYLAALYWLLIAVIKLTESIKVMSAVGLALALSPLQVGWFRFVLTEPLALASATWFLAEMINSIALRKLRVFHLALALTASIYIRPDTIFMALGVFLLTFCLYNIKKAICSAALFVIIISISTSGWMLRNIVVGAAPLGMRSESAPIAPGYFSWLDTWITNEYERSDANFPVWRKRYSEITLHNSRYVSEAELAVANGLVRQLSEYDGRDFPRDIDHQFSELVEQRNSSGTFFRQVQVYVSRACLLLLNPFSSWGLPLEVGGGDRGAFKDAIGRRDWIELANLMSIHKTLVFGKIMGFSYRGVIFIGFLLISLFVLFKTSTGFYRDQLPGIRVLVLATAVAACARLLFFVIVGGLESRYLVECLPWVECCLVLWLFGEDRGRSGSRSVDGVSK